METSRRWRTKHQLKKHSCGKHSLCIQQQGLSNSIPTHGITDSSATAGFLLLLWQSRVGWALSGSQRKRREKVLH